MRGHRAFGVGLAVVGLLFFGTTTALASNEFCDVVTATECEVTTSHAASGPYTIDRTLHIFNGGALVTGAIGIDITITPSGDFLMDSGALIDGNVGGNGTGGPITVTLDDGDVNLMPGSIIRSNSGSGGAIQITTTPSHTANIDGTVESVGSLSGTGANQRPGGGTITIIAGCSLTVSDTGLVSSRGKDPGADLVHLEACAVTIYGIVESTGPGHANPNNPANHCNLEPAAHDPLSAGHSQFFTGCVEIWSGTTVLIDSTPFAGPPAGVHHGEINADIGFTGGTGGRGWIDIYANGTITIKDGTGNDRNAPTPGGGTYPTSFAVHSNGGIGQSTDDGGLITIKSLAGDVIAASGDAIQADAISGGSNGGNIYVEAFNNVTFTANLFARGDFVATGGFGDGGQGGTIGVPMRAYQSAFSWTSGTGDVRPTGDLATLPVAKRGEINLQGCTAVTLGATFPFLGANPTTPTTTVVCAAPGVGPTKATAGSLPGSTCFADFCGATKRGMKFNDLNANGVKDPGEPGLENWEIKIYDASDNLVDTKLTDVNGNYEFKGLAAGNYTVCETPQAGWTQSFPVAGPGTTTCGNLTIGYAITLAQGQLDEGNDFGNWQPAKKSGRKFNDLLGDHIDDITDPGLQNWEISIYDASNTLVSSQLTDVNGHYEFTGLTPGSYTVCETPQPPTWTQTFPQLGVQPGTVTCANLTIGYAITLISGQNETNNDFGNHTQVTPPTCKEDPGRAALLTRTVDTSKPAGGGTGDPGNPVNYLTVQAAYDAAKVSPITKDEVIGLYSKTTENVTLDDYTAKSMTLTQCTSAQVTAANSGAPVWDLTANRKLLIISPDAVGGTVGWLVETGGHDLKSIRADYATVAGIKVIGSNNSISWNDADNNFVGVDVWGSKNTLKGGSVSFNATVGVHFNAGADTNTLSGATIESNDSDGVFIEGGAGNIIKSNTANKNKGDGFRNKGSNTKFTSNKSNNGAPLGKYENIGAEYRFVTTGINGGSNKADGVTVPNALKGCTSFNAGQVCE